LLMIFAFLLPSSIRLRIRSLFTVVKEVSADEKNADNKSNTMSTIICAATLGSIFKISLLLKILFSIQHLAIRHIIIPYFTFNVN